MACISVHRSSCYKMLNHHRTEHKVYSDVWMGRRMSKDDDNDLMTLPGSNVCLRVLCTELNRTRISRQTTKVT